MRVLLCMRACVCVCARVCVCVCVASGWVGVADNGKALLRRYVCGGQGLLIHVIVCRYLSSNTHMVMCAPCACAAWMVNIESLVAGSATWWCRRMPSCWQDPLALLVLSAERCVRLCVCVCARARVCARWLLLWCPCLLLAAFLISLSDFSMFSALPKRL